MSDDPKTKDRPFDMSMMPFFGLDLGRELGSMDSRLSRVENDILKLSAKVDQVDSRVDKCLVAITRMDERVAALAEGRKSDRALMVGLWVAVVAGLILQYFK